MIYSERNHEMSLALCVNTHFSFPRPFKLCDCARLFPFLGNCHLSLLLSPPLFIMKNKRERKKSKPGKERVHPFCIFLLCALVLSLKKTKTNKTSCRFAKRRPKMSASRHSNLNHTPLKVYISSIVTYNLLHFLYIFYIMLSKINLNMMV